MYPNQENWICATSWAQTCFSASCGDPSAWSGQIGFNLRPTAKTYSALPSHMHADLKYTRHWAAFCQQVLARQNVFQVNRLLLKIFLGSKI
jgi:hypothetical protein